jgi:prepilin-type N-terminal cleavage/methylation domain-containing protein
MDVKKKTGFTLIELMIVIAVIAVIAAIAIPGLLRSQRASNERNASASLKAVTTAETDFRANDRDGNRIADFWTFNIAGLYTLTSGAILGTTGDDPIKLIELSMAGAEAQTLTAAAGEYSAINTFCVQGVKAGHWFQSLRSDLSDAVPESYLTDTNGAPPPGVGANLTHHAQKFGFMAWPDSLAVGAFALIINENHTVYRRALTASLRPSLLLPPGIATDTNYLDWPTGGTLKAFWGKLD